jgi:hypothetical protein
MLAILVSIEKKLAICTNVTKIRLGLVKLLASESERTTPGMARKLTLTASITVAWKVVT